MGINALASALATPPTPAVPLSGGQRDRSESASGSNEVPTSVPRVVFNPRSHFDASAGVFVMEYRSASSGEIERQFPDEQQLRAYENAKKIEAARSKGESAASAVESALDTKAPATAETPTRVPAETKTDVAQASAKTYQPVRLEV